MLGLLGFGTADAVSLFSRFQQQQIAVQTLGDGAYNLEIDQPSTGEVVHVIINGVKGPVRELTASYSGFSAEAGTFALGKVLGNLAYCFDEPLEQARAGAEFFGASYNRAVQNGTGQFRRNFGPYAYAIGVNSYTNGSVGISIRLSVPASHATRCTLP